jgi:hypothetical protein
MKRESKNDEKDEAIDDNGAKLHPERKTFEGLK